MGIKSMWDIIVNDAPHKVFLIIADLGINPYVMLFPKLYPLSSNKEALEGNTWSFVDGSGSCLFMRLRNFRVQHVGDDRPV